ncbi:MAG: DUF721 domain-containing protein [Pseudomonadota bacterium]
MTKPYKKFHQIKHPHKNSALTALLDQLKTLDHLNKQWQSIVNNEQLIAHTRPVSQQNNRLVIAVDSPAWASKLHYQSSDLLAQWRQQINPALSGIDVMVTATPFKDSIADIASPSRALSPLSLENISALTQLAKSVSNPQLKKALSDFVATASQHRKSGIGA